MKTIRGLNLGGWLVLEKWMTPELYKGTQVEDEYHLLQETVNPQAMLQKHRDSFITEADFIWIHEHGIDTVRIPVGHWLFDAEPPYFSAKFYLDQAFLWANRHGLKIMLDVHAAKGCQNGFDNGGLSGVCEWHLYESNIENTLSFIRKLCETYQNNPALSGIELLNEPHGKIDIKIIQNFYKKGYDIVREVLGDEVYVVFHDAFRISEWKEFLETNAFVNAFLDTHMYQVFGEIKSDATLFELFHFLLKERLETILELKKYTKIVIGEWSLGIPRKMMDKAEDETTKTAYFQSLGALLYLIYDMADGWFFWSYKLSEISTAEHFGWSFRNMVENGYLPFKEKE